MAHIYNPRTHEIQQENEEYQPRICDCNVFVLGMGWGAETDTERQTETVCDCQNLKHKSGPN